MNFDSIPSGWKWKKLGEVCEKSEYGYTTSAKQNGADPQFLRTTDITNGDINWKSVPFCADPPNDEERYRLKDGDILISRAGSVGTAVVIKNPPRSIFASYLIRFRPREELNPSFAGFFLKSNLYWAQLGSKMSGTTLPGVNATNLSKVKIPLPPLPTQKKIAALLEKAEKLREWRKEADGLTDRFLKSTFLEMFGDPLENPKGWKKGKMGDFFSDVRYGVSMKSSSKGFPIIGMNSISYEGIIDWNNLSKVDLSPDIFQKEKLEKYDLLFNRTNASNLVGKTGIVDKEIDAVAASYLIRLRIMPSFQPYFVWYLMNSPFLKAIFCQKCKKAVNQANINSKELAAFPAIFPPLPLQQKFASIVQQVEQIRAHQTQSRQHIDNFFNVLMQRAFRGELEA
ncbi:Type-1 restriction enzyme MjaXIP specificity protein [uncultured archaeon]|nr:Type-1 restriction enzyme MjaXIP specificity protein [uncultured archaeon]